MVRGRRHVYLLLCCNQTGRSCDLSQKGLLVKKIKGERKTVSIKISERSTTWFPEGPGEVGEILFRKIRVVVVIVVVAKVDEASRPDAMLWFFSLQKLIWVICLVLLVFLTMWRITQARTSVSLQRRHFSSSWSCWRPCWLCGRARRARCRGCKDRSDLIGC